MVEFRVRTRKIGATAEIGRQGHAHLTSDTGGTAEVVSGASMVGFNPLDTLFASLAACLAYSARIAASELKLADRFTGATVHVTGDKVTEGPSRITAFKADFAITGDFSAQEREAIAHHAEAICTVSNTLRASAPISIAFSAQGQTEQSPD